MSTNGERPTKVAVVAHSDKRLGGGLGELREILEREGYADPLWFEVSKSRQARKCAKQAVSQGADLVFAWGGDSTVQRCLDAMVGTDVLLAILPAGTANLLARNLDVPVDLGEAVAIGVRGQRVAIDTGSINGEHFAVMAGAGFDATMVGGTDHGMKGRLGQLAYAWTAARNLKAHPVKAKVKVEGRSFYKGAISSVLVANVSEVLGGVEVFQRSRADDGLLELGIVTARSRMQWIRTLGEVAAGRIEKSPFVHATRGTCMTIKFARKWRYELDGGERPATKRLDVGVHPESLRVCIPWPSTQQG